MYTGLYHTHKTVVILFILIYLIKTVLLVTGRKDTLRTFSSKIKVAEIVISSIFLITGVWLLFTTSEIRPLFIVKLAMVVIAVPIAMIGFRKENAMGVLAFVLIIGAYGVAEMNRKAMLRTMDLPKNVVVDASDPGYDIQVHGKALFQNQCSVCHGEDGNLQMSGAKDLTVSVMTKEEVIQRIKLGKITMIAYEDHFSAEEIDALAEYVITLR